MMIGDRRGVGNPTAWAFVVGIGVGKSLSRNAFGFGG
jgi:hypothetical protein